MSFRSFETASKPLPQRVDTMKGKQINTLCKTIGTFCDKVPMKGKLTTVDPAHILMMQIESLDKTPIFGIVNDDVVLDVDEVLKIKIGDKEELSPSMENFRYTLYNDVTKYSFIVDENVHRDPKVPNLTELKRFDNINTKKFLEISNQASIISDYIILDVADKKLGTFTEDKKNSTQITKILCPSIDWDYDIRVCFPLDYLKRILKVVSTPTFTLDLDTDYPCRITWADEWYKYRVLLAPRIENKE